MLLSENQESYETVTGINESEQKLTNIITTVLKKSVPILKSRHYRKPALQNYILDLMKSRKKAEQIYLREKINLTTLPGQSWTI